MTITKLSKKQKDVMRFAVSNDSYLVCDGAVRSGKTTIMTMAFVIWAMEHFERCNFGICSKTVSAAERNILKPLQELQCLPYKLKYKITDRMLTVQCGKKENYFYFFGGKDESSYSLIQGITLAGVLLDEVALMPRSFVEQAMARTLSYENAKIWFNCNPENPQHWFYNEWIKTPRKSLKHLHFLMEDNPIMSAESIAKTKTMYTGAFYDRYILGLWVAAEGLIYPQFTLDNNVVKTIPRAYTKHYISMDYGTYNPCSMGLWGLCEGVWYRIKEYYHNGREGEIKTDEDYYSDLLALAENREITSIIIDPSASSFIALLLKKKKFRVQKANNAVVEGINNTAIALSGKKILINDCCEDIIKEFGGYLWDSKAVKDTPIKQNDHAMDDLRYFVMNVLRFEKPPKAPPQPSTLAPFFTDKPKPQALGRGDKVHVI